MMTKVFITQKIHSIAKKMLEEQGFTVVTWSGELPPTQTNIIEQAQDCDAIISMLHDQLDKACLQQLPKLKVIANYAVGYNNIDCEYASENKILVGNTPDVLTAATADLALTLLMATSRKFVAARNFIEKQKWIKWESSKLLGQELRNKTLGIVGMGRIGSEFARLCSQAFGMKVIYSSSTGGEKKTSFDSQLVVFHKLVCESDVISIHCPLTQETNKLFDKTVFEKLKPNCILINTSRGAIINHDDLLAALDENKLWAAGLDVTDPEPLSESSELYKHSKVTVLPHIGSATIETRKKMAEISAMNIINAITKSGKGYFVNSESF
jgi:glyoxylate reductase